MKKLFLVITILSALTALACNRQENPSGANKSGAAQNKPAQDITLKSINGTEVKLSDLKGKVVMLNFWATWCPPCKEEIPSMMSLNKQMEGKPFQMLAVSIDEGGKADVEAFYKKTGFMLPTYIDQDRKAAAVYGVTGVPETYIIDTKGVIVKKVIGPLKWDGAEVLSFLNGLMK
jgi:cytochrome c biogenesis protein CcmG, thiol:disulfide interchange protein DsbE